MLKHEWWCCLVNYLSKRAMEELRTGICGLLFLLFARKNEGEVVRPFDWDCDVLESRGKRDSYSPEVNLHRNLQMVADGCRCFRRGLKKRLTKRCNKKDEYILVENIQYRISSSSSSSSSSSYLQNHRTHRDCSNYRCLPMVLILNHRNCFH